MSDEECWENQERGTQDPSADENGQVGPCTSCRCQLALIKDPVADSTYEDIWMATAKTNTRICQDVFCLHPDDHIHSRAAIRQSVVARWKEKLGHTIDLGVAPMKIESYDNGDLKDIDPMERLALVKGHLVSFPLDFMCKEDLRPVLNESEYYA